MSNPEHAPRPGPARRLAELQAARTAGLFLNQLEPLGTPERMAAGHAALVEGLEREGPAVLRESAAALFAAG